MFRRCRTRFCLLDVIAGEINRGHSTRVGTRLFILFFPRRCSGNPRVCAVEYNGVKAAEFIRREIGIHK